MGRSVLWILAVLLACGTPADSIKVGKRLYSNVYIRSDGSNHHIHFPDEGRVEKVSRKRTDVGEPRIDGDPAVRAALLDRFNQNKALTVEKAPSTTTAKRPAATSAAPSGTLDSKAIHEQNRLREQALEDAQMEFWRTLSAEERALVIENLLRVAQENQANFEQERMRLDREIEALNTQAAQHQEEIGRLATLRDQAQQEVIRRDNSDAIERQLEESLATFGQSSNSILIREILGDAATAQAGQATEDRDEINRQYKRSVAPLQAALDAIGRSLAAVEDFGISLAQSSTQVAERVASFQSRIATMNGNLGKPYTPDLPGTVVAEWRGVSSFKSEPFEISEPFWLLDIRRKDFGRPGRFAVTVYVAETNQPFTRITSVDYLQMRVQVLDDPGRYYLKIEQDESALPYEIRAVTFAK